MNSYILYTRQGHTLAPDAETPLHNYQILGFVTAPSAADAHARLLAENPWIAAFGFDPAEIICRQLA